MLDNGASLNIIKLSALRRDLPVNIYEKKQISEITNEAIDTIGTINIQIKNDIEPFHVVPNAFPITSDGMLGRNFFKKHEAVISYYKNALMISGDVMHPIPFIDAEEEIDDLGNEMFKELGFDTKLRLNPIHVQEETKIPDVSISQTQDEIKPQVFTVKARTKQMIKINLINSQGNTGYLPRIDTGHEGVYLGEALVSNEDNSCRIFAINTNEEDVTFDVNPKELLPYELFEPDFLTDSGSEVNQEICSDENERIDRLKKLIRKEHLNVQEQESIDRLIVEFSDVFLLPGDPLPCTNKIEHEIPTVDNIPVFTKQYRHPPVHKNVVKEQVQKKLEQDIIEPSSSPYNAPIWIVPKKPDSQGNPRWRVVIDFRDLNKKTIGDAYPLPNINDILDQLGGAMYFSTFDLASGFQQIPLKEEDRPKTAFSTGNGHFQYKRMPEGLKGAPATFQRCMDEVLRGLTNEELLVYLDDIIIYARNLWEHEKRAKRLLQRLREARLVLQPDKVEFLRREVQFLGHIISERGVEPNTNKLEAVKDFPTPTRVRKIREFLGLAGYYRRFIADFSKIARPLNDLLKKGVDFIWGPEQENSFQELKGRLCEAPILAFPDFKKNLYSYN